ncbi:unnamed protein product [Prunus armeniaca]
MAGMAARMLAAAEGRKESGLIVAGILEQPRDVKGSVGASLFPTGSVGSGLFPASKREYWDILISSG